jgi:hypothetical protein
MDGAVDARVIDQDVDTTHAFDRGSKRNLDRCEVRNVHGLQECRREVRVRSIEGIGLAVPYHDACTFTGQALRDAAPDTANGTRDDRHLSRE